MRNREGLVVLVTGANTGLGKEAARQLAMRSDVGCVYLACRNDEKAAAAERDLVAWTGRSIFTRVRFDVSDIKSAHAVLEAVGEPLDAVIMNAGGTGGPSPMQRTADGVTQLFASNIPGHVALLEGLIARGGLRQAALLSSTEAARGVPRMRIPRPTFGDHSVEEFVSVIDGSFFSHHRYQPMLAYGQVKLLGSLWMAAKASQHPDLRLISMSPGGTVGTEIARDQPAVMRAFANGFFLPHVAPHIGLAHKLETGAKRLVDGITDRSLKSGSFYGSGPKVLTGPIIDQGEIAPILFDPIAHKNADAAIHRFVPLP